MIIQKKSWLGFVLVASLFCSGCKSGGAGMNPGNSSLQGVFDSQYLLRFSKVKDDASLYRFESCFVSGSRGEVVEGSCVGALQDLEGKDITLSVDVVSRSVLTELEKQQLDQISAGWQKYRKSLAGKERGDQAATAITVGSGAVMGSFLALNASDIKSQNLLIDHIVKEEGAKLGALQAQSKKLQQGWVDRFGKRNSEQALKLIEAHEKKLLSLGYSMSEPPHSVFSGAKNIDALVSGLKERGHILSDKFYSFLEKQWKNQWDASLLRERGGFAMELHSKGIGTLQDLLKEYTHTFSKINYKINLAKNMGFNVDDLVDRFLNQQYPMSRRGAVSELIHPDYSDHFFKFNKINRTLFDLEIDAPTSYDEMLKTVSGEGRSYTVFTHMNDFVKHEGVPVRVKHAYDHVLKLKYYYGKATSSQIPDAVKAAVIKSQGRMRNAGKNLAGLLSEGRLFRRGIPAAILGTGVVVAGVVTFSRGGLKSTQSKLTALQTRDDHLQLLLSDDSLLRSDSSSAVSTSSVKELLKSVSLWQQNFWVDLEDTGIRVAYYCLPATESAPGGLIVAECYDVDE